MGQMTIQLRKLPMLKELYAVFGELNGYYICYCLNDKEFCRMEKDLIKRRTKPVKDNIPELLSIVSEVFPETELINVNDLRKL